MTMHFKTFIFLLYGYQCFPLCVSVPGACRAQERALNLQELEVIDGCDMLCGCWEVDPEEHVSSPAWEGFSASTNSIERKKMKHQIQEWQPPVFKLPFV